MKLISVSAIFFLQFVLITVPERVFAKLGGDISTASDVLIPLGSTLEEVRDDSKHYIELNTNGHYVRQHVAADGHSIAAITYRGMFDSQSMLGDVYQKEYADGLKNAKRSRFQRFSVIETEHLHIERGGHQRDIVGRIILKQVAEKKYWSRFR